MPMRRLGVPVLFFIMLLAISTPALAQDAPRVGVTMAYPASVGAWVQLSERIALRPDLSFSWSSYETNISDALGQREYASDYLSTSFGVSAIVTIAQWDALRAYVAPRVSYTRITQNSPTVSFAPVGSPPVIEQHEDVTDGFDVGATFGAYYPLHDRLRVFGEVGAMYLSQSGEREDGRVSQKAFANRTSVGLVLMF
jgi:hypothetical protein